MTPNDDARVRAIESKLAALERMLKPTGGLGQGVSTSYGSLNIRSTQLGFAAELTSTFNATTGYNWKRLALDTTGSITLTNPAIQLTGNRAYSIDGSTTLASGTKGWLEPSPESSGYLFTTASSASAGFFARLTTSSGGNWNFYKLKLSSGSYTDDGAEVTGYNAVPLTIDGTNLCNPVAGLRVWMIPSQQSGKYEFLPIGMATATSATSGLPGLMSETTQAFAGDKTFYSNVNVGTSVAKKTVTVNGGAGPTDTGGSDYPPHVDAYGRIQTSGRMVAWRPNGINTMVSGISLDCVTTTTIDSNGVWVPQCSLISFIDEENNGGTLRGFWGLGANESPVGFTYWFATAASSTDYPITDATFVPVFITAACDRSGEIGGFAISDYDGLVSDFGQWSTLPYKDHDDVAQTAVFKGGILISNTYGGGELTGFAKGTELIRFRNPKPLTLTPARPIAVVTAATGKRGRELLEVSGPLMQAYATRLGADFVTLTKRHPSYALSVKWGIRRVLEHYERIVFLDADILVPTDAPNLFDLCRVSNIGASDELPWLTMANPKVLDEYQWVRTGQGKQRVPCSQYFNSGVIVASRYHADLFGPPPGPAPVHHCLEQHWWNARLYDTATPVTVLPREANWQWWTDREFKVAPPNAMLHFSGIKSHTSRMRYMRHFAAKLSS